MCILCLFAALLKLIKPKHVDYKVLKIVKTLSCAAIFIFLFTIQPISIDIVNAKDLHPGFKKLAQRLEADGIDKQYIQKVFAREELSLMPETVAFSLTIKEARLNYSRFLKKNSVDRAVFYLNKHLKILNKIENLFGVSAPVIVAILNVETACGKYTGSINTFNILATQALSLEPEIYQQIRRKIPTKSRSDLSSQKIKQKLKKKSIRSYRELKALIKYVQGNGIDPFSIKGSTEGAIGLSQFLPSNIKRYGFDGNGDGKIDLFHHEDAIASIASYLKAHKWNENSNFQAKKRVILKYNYSDYYARTVLKLSEILSDYR